MREVNKLIIHCSATPEGRYHDVEDIRGWHKARGWSDVGYHFIILLDGTIQRGRDMRNQGAHVRGHNRDSIGICYIGGVDSDMRPKDTRTPEQKAALRSVVSNLKLLYKGARVFGHNEFSSKACPSFNVQTDL